MNKKITLVLILILLVAGAVVIQLQVKNSFAHKDMHEKREEFVQEKDHIIGELLAQGDYTCCLKKPCTYCIEKTPGHGEGATCNCLADIVEGRHPCGECIGEILEGHGNKLLSKYFATAIAEEVGEEHLETLQKIITQKYPRTPIQEAGMNNSCEIDKKEGCLE
jgi:hypothetical protein